MLKYKSIVLVLLFFLFWSGAPTDAVFLDCTQKAEIALKNNHFEEGLAWALKIDSLIAHATIKNPLQQAENNRLQAWALRKLKRLDEAWNKLNEAENQANSVSSQERLEILAKIYNQMGAVQNKKANYQAALSYYAKVIELKQAKSIRDAETIVETYFWQGNTFDNLAKNAEALASFRSGIVYCEQHLTPIHPHIADMLNNMAGIFRRQGNMEEALIYYEKALFVFTKYYGEGHKESYFFYNNLGNVYFAKGNYSQAKEYFQKSLEIYSQHYSLEEPPIDVFYVNLANNHLLDGATATALDFFQKALTIRVKFYGENYPSTAAAYNYVGSALATMKSYTEALSYYQKALAIYEKLQLNELPEMADCYNNLGDTYLAQKEHQKALSCFHKALKITKKVYGKDHYTSPKILHNIGNVYFQQKNFQQAQSYFQEAATIYERKFGTTYPELARSYLNLFNNAVAQKQDKNAINFIQKALIALQYNEKDSLLEQCASPLLLLETFKQWADFTVVGNEFLAAAQYDKALKIFDLIQENFEDETARQQLNAQQQSLFENAMLTFVKCYEKTQDKKWLRKAQVLAEKGKYNQLLRTLRFSSILQIAGVEEKARKNLVNLTASIAYYEKQIFDIKYSNDSVKLLNINELQSKFFNLKQQLTQQKTAILHQYPKVKTLLNLNQLEAPSTHLQKGDVIIEYTFAKDALLAFMFSASGEKVYRLAYNQKQQLNALLRAFRQMLSSPPSGKAPDNQEFAALSHLLYQQIFLPIAKDFPDDVQHITIIPDAALNFMPFETLLSQPTLQKEHFLLQQFEISYANSIRLLAEQNKPNTQPTPKTWAGFAAKYPSEGIVIDNNERLFPLSKNEDEVRQIAALTKGDVFLAEAATKEHFKQKAGKYRVLHLSMHATVKDDNPMSSALIFTSQNTDIEQISTTDLYQIRLPADLIVLSACKTGVGKIYEGEGVYSLSRAFTYAGAKSQVVSLWQVPDVATSQLMTQFYQSLTQGQVKSKALQYCKQSFLQSALAPELQHPYYWAGFILQGNNQSVDFQSTTPIGYYFLLCYLVFFVGFVLRQFIH